MRFAITSIARLWHVRSTDKNERNTPLNSRRLTISGVEFYSEAILLKRVCFSNSSCHGGGIFDLCESGGYQLSRVGKISLEGT